VLPCLLFEDEDLLVVNKPAGLNTHAPGPFAGEGLFDWLRYREARWADLAIIHRLDKETSGVMVFAKTSKANRALTRQFTERNVGKRYLLLTDRPVPSEDFTARCALVRAGDKYVGRAWTGAGTLAETRFHRAGRTELPCAGYDPSTLVEAEPRTGRTHQIRVQAAAGGFPILGDALYGGTPFRRVCLHASELRFQHPATGAEMVFESRPDFAADPRMALRAALIDPADTDAYRVVHGASDRWPGWYLDRLGSFLLSQSAQALSPKQLKALEDFCLQFGARGIWHKTLIRRVSGRSRGAASPQRVLGEPGADRFVIRENGVEYELSFQEGYSVGLFLDQRDNRRRLLTSRVAVGFELPAAMRVLNAFAYTCGFSVCAAKAGAQTTSLDLSKKHLEWGRRNFVLNQIDPAGHAFIFGDAFDWLRRLRRRQDRFDLVLLDPPTFSQSKDSRAFRAEKDYGELVAAALPLVKPGGVLFASTNAADWPAEDFLGRVGEAARAGNRAIRQRHFAPQPPDFPLSNAEPAYLKTVWLRLA
jgi:23S rRNA (cytosine1962-C5)-methyltransferase